MAGKSKSARTVQEIVAEVGRAQVERSRRNSITVHVNLTFDEIHAMGRLVERLTVAKLRQDKLTKEGRDELGALEAISMALPFQWLQD